jgi:UDP-N-acetyl-D-mannosaminuronic acid dehydrogenase
MDVLVPILEESGFSASRVNSADQTSSQTNFQSPSQADIFYVAHCPERVLPGKILEELIHNDRVIGGICSESARRAKTLYTSFVQGGILLTDATTAEFVKLMENTSRDVNIALANEFALVAEGVGINVFEAIAMANRHPRVNILKPGPGVGGHCIAVDPWFIVQSAADSTPIIQTARQINDEMPAFVVKRVKESFAQTTGLKVEQHSSPIVIACLGLAYKANVDDARESPALTVVKLLQDDGFEVKAYDPHVPLGTVMCQVDSIDNAIMDADAILILTAHSEFKDLSPDNLPGFNGKVVMDTHNILNLEQWRLRSDFVWQLGNQQLNQM